MRFESNVNVLWYIESNSHAPVLLNLLNLLRKSDKMLGKRLKFYHFPQLI